MTHDTKTARKSLSSLIFYGYPARLIAEWCGVCYALSCGFAICRALRLAT